jgi:WD40 repeat protein
MHTAAIRRIDVDREERFLVSGSLDKTARVWDFASGRLLRTLRVPLGEGDVGKVYAVAISPDGTTVAVGDYTGKASGSHIIYIFDLATGVLRHRIEGLPRAIIHLAYAPDGQRLAAVFGGANGLRVYETGYLDSTQVDVLASKDLTRAYAANMMGVDKGNLFIVAWLRDGLFLYGAGTYNVSEWCPIRRWDLGGKGAFVEWQVATNTIMGLRPLADGKLAIAAHDPLVAMLDEDGKVRWQQRGAIADFRGQRGERGPRVSHTGDVVQFSFEQQGKRPARFAMHDAQLTLDPPTDQSLVGPVTTASGLVIRAWADRNHPTLNDKPLALAPDETSQSLAIAPDGQRFLLGTTWWLRLFNRDGTQRWRVAAPGTTRAVTVTPDARTAIAGFSDGTLRWYRLQDGVELLAFFPHPDG